MNMFFSPKFRYFLTEIRGKFYRFFLKKSGHTFLVEDHFRALGIKNISVGNYVYLNHHVELIAENSSITIGNYVRIGHYSRVLTLIHEYKDKKTPIFFQPFRYAPVIIEDDVWIGTNCVIMPGVTLHKGCVVGAGAIVTKDVPSYCVVAGVPAKVIKKR